MKWALTAPVALLAISGCAMQTQNIQKHLLNAPAIGPKASTTRGVVIGTVDEKAMFGFLPDGMQVIFKSTEPDPNLKDPTGQVKTFYQLIENNLDLAATIPGTYYLQSLVVNSTITSYNFASWNKQMENRYGSFVLGAGEVIYIGNIKLAPKGMTLRMQVEDRFDEMKGTLPPELAGKMVKKLLLLPESITFDQSTSTPLRR